MTLETGFQVSGLVHRFEVDSEALYVKLEPLMVYIVTAGSTAS
jgi:hypothetical protein